MIPLLHGSRRLDKANSGLQAAKEQAQLATIIRQQQENYLALAEELKEVRTV